MAIEERVLIAGAGPVGLVAAANLVRNGVPVTVFDNRTITGFDVEALSAAVAEWRATLPGPSQS